MSNLIQVKQLPIIEEKLRAVKEQVDTIVADAMALVCTEETVQSIKATRADLNRQLQELEVQRKSVKAAVLEPYERFEVVYRECVSDAFKRADADLKQKVNDVEGEMKRRCEESLREYFLELCELHHINFVRYEQARIAITLADAKAKTQPPKRLREQLDSFMSGIARDVELIAGMDHAEEIMVEYTVSLDTPRSIALVQARHRHIEEQKAAMAARKETTDRETEVVKTVEAFAPPVPVPSQTKVGTVTFTITDTIDRLKLLKQFLVSNGYKYQ